MSENSIKIYTDGSCHPQSRTGAWAAIIFSGNDKIILNKLVKDTTHNRMELKAVIEAIEYLQKNKIIYQDINIFTDSQYVVKIPDRMQQLIGNDFLTKKKKLIRNHDLVRQLIQYIKAEPIHFIKVAAHQKQTDSVNYNREVDKLVRKKLRAYLQDLKI